MSRKPRPRRDPDAEAYAREMGATAEKLEAVFDAADQQQAAHTRLAEKVKASRSLSRAKPTDRQSIGTFEYEADRLFLDVQAMPMPDFPMNLHSTKTVCVQRPKLVWMMKRQSFGTRFPLAISERFTITG
jgi:hypothetical protein